MSSSPLDDVVANQYERWVYPEPIYDLEAWSAHSWQWYDPSHAHRMLWPEKSEVRSDLDILVAGCGTNQAAVFAFSNPQARVVAIDVSESSLAHHRWLKEKYSLDNLELHLLPIEDVPTLGRDFDLIVSTGVLHHLADPGVGLRALAGCLRPDGVMGLMLYARYGRVGVEMMQSVFRDVGLDQSPESLFVVRQALAVLPDHHPVVDYLGIATDLSVDAGVVDTFLHGRDTSFTVDDCLRLVETSGLAFQGWLLKSSYYPPIGSDNAFHAAVRLLPAEQQWSVMERVNSRNACHFFMVRKADLDPAAYAVDFSADGALDHVPSFRYRCAITDTGVTRYDWAMNLNPVDYALARKIDGKRTVREVIDAASKMGGLAHSGLTDLDARALRLMQSLWQLDVIAVGTGGNHHG